MNPFRRKAKAEGAGPQVDHKQDTMGWETHPCTLPNEDLEISHLNNTWQCWCGRRWLLVSRNIRLEVDGYHVQYRWRELEHASAFQVTDEEIEQFLENPDV